MTAHATPRHQVGAPAPSGPDTDAGADTGRARPALTVAPRPFDTGISHRVTYVARLLWLPALCLAVALVALNRADAANQPVPERPRVDQPAAVTPVLSARRVAASLAFPAWAARLAPPLNASVAQLPVDTSCAVATSASGQLIYAHNATAPVIPASTQKLLTAYTALAGLGPDYRFRTTLATDARVVDGVVQGDVWLIGGGDPVLATANYPASFAHQPQTFTDIAALLNGLKAAGVTRIRGALVADATRYDDQRYVPTWPARFRSGTGENPSGPLSALNLNDGFTSFPPAGQEFGGSGARTVSANPGLTTGQRTVELLASGGIGVDGGVRAAKAPPVTTPLAFADSPPLKDIVAHMLRESDNATAELLLKEIGLAKAGQGTTAAGAGVVTQFLKDQGLAPPELVVADGSGLGDGNRVTCALLTQILARSGRAGVLGEGLPVAGTTGTLTDRFLGSAAVGRVRAKTGTLAGIAGLAGWVDTAKASTVAFAVVANEGGDEEALKPIEDGLAAVLLSYPEGPTVAELGPVAAR